MQTTSLKRFASGILAGVGGMLAALIGLYAFLAVALPSNLPAPALSPLAALDEKLRFVRTHPEIDPHILAVGSSITWRQIAGGEFTELAGGPKRFLNGATVHMQIDQTRALTDFYLHNYGDVRTVLFMTSLPDFESCGARSERILDAGDAAAYAFHGWPAPYFYLRYFSPRRYISSAMSLPQRREPFQGDLFLDAWGSGPLNLPESVDLGLRYKAIHPQPACVEALSAFLQHLSDRGLRTVLVFAPIHPKYRDAYPVAVHQLERAAERIASTLPPNTQVLLLHDDPAFMADDFFDAFHLEYPAARRLSELVARAMSHHGPPHVLNGQMVRCMNGRAQCPDRRMLPVPVRLTPASLRRG